MVTYRKMRHKNAEDISKEPAAHLSVKLSCNWLIFVVTMATLVSSHPKVKNNIFTARDEGMIFFF